MIVAATEALPDGGDYVAAAYLVLTALLLIYLALMAIRLGRLEREVLSIHSLLDVRDSAGDDRSSDEAPADD